MSWTRTLAVALTLALTACDGSTPAEPAEPAPTPAPTPAPAPAPEVAPAPSPSGPAVVVPPASGLVSLTAAGVKLDPPAAKDQIPDGAWYCDMGSVHFAASEQNDGTCAVCGMALVHQGPAGHDEH